MIKIQLFALGTALLLSSCATRYTSLPADAGVAPDADALLKTMSTRLADSSNYRFTVTRTMPKERAEMMHQPTKAEIEVMVARPNKLAVKISGKGAPGEMIFDGHTFSVVDGPNKFYSKAPLQGSLDKVPEYLSQRYGFQPPLVEFILSNPYAGIKSRVAAVSYLGKGNVNEEGKTVPCHRISLQGELADGELWLGAADSLPRRLKITAKNSAGSGLIMDVDFLTWNLKAQTSDSTFRYQPPTGAEEIPMISLSEANAAKR